MTLELVAIMDRAAAKRALGTWTGPSFDIVEAKDLAAILTKTGKRRGLFAQLSGNTKQIVQALLARQKLYEHLLTEGDVLPVQQGSAMDPADAKRFLSANAPKLGTLADLHARQVQYQLTVQWDPAEALKRFRDEAELLGRADAKGIAEGAEALRARFGQTFARTLDAAVKDRVALPLDGPETVLNDAILVDRDGMPTLDAALLEIDATWTEGLRLKLAGPLPPVSFCLLAVKRVRPRDLRAAWQALGVTGSAEPESVDRAFREQVKRTHPDVAGQTVDMAALQTARELLTRAQQAEEALGHACPDPLHLAEVIREGESSAAETGRERAAHNEPTV